MEDYHGFQLHTNIGVKLPALDFDPVYKSRSDFKGINLAKKVDLYTVKYGSFSSRKKERDRAAILIGKFSETFEKFAHKSALKWKFSKFFGQVK